MSDDGRGVQRGNSPPNDFQSSRRNNIQQLFARLSQEIEEKDPANVIFFVVDFLCKHYPRHLAGFASIWNGDPDLERDRLQVVEFFRFQKLPTEIASQFTNAGFDTLETLCTITPEALDDIERFNQARWLPGHRVRLQQTFTDVCSRVRAYRQEREKLLHIARLTNGHCDHPTVVTRTNVPAPLFPAATVGPNPLPHIRSLPPNAGTTTIVPPPMTGVSMGGPDSRPFVTVNSSSPNPSTNNVIDEEKDTHLKHAPAIDTQIGGNDGSSLSQSYNSAMLSAPVDDIQQAISQRDNLFVTSLDPLVTAYGAEVLNINEPINTAAALETTFPKNTMQDQQSHSPYNNENSVAQIFPILLETQKLPHWTWDVSGWDTTYTFASSREEAVKCSLTRDSVYNTLLMKDSLVCDANKVMELWKEKSELDSWFDADKGTLYRMARETVFPQERYRGNSFFNRTGAKLKEVADAVNLVQRFFSRGGVFLDVLGTRRAWCDFFSACWKQLRLEAAQQDNTVPEPKCIAVLSSSAINNDDGLPRKGALASSPKRKWYTGIFLAYKKKISNTELVVPGVSLTRDILEPDVIDSIKNFVSSTEGSLVNLVVADGALKIGRDPTTGEHLENYQEIFNSRSLLSQTILALHTLQPSGDFIVKLFDNFSNFTVSLIFLLGQLFDSATIVKPYRSRPVNSERYLACIGMKTDHNAMTIKKMLNEVYMVWSMSPHKNDGCPNALLPLPLMMTGNYNIRRSISFPLDTIFMTSTRQMTTVLCERQCSALRRVINEVSTQNLGTRALLQVISLEAQQRFITIKAINTNMQLCNTDLNTNMQTNNSSFFVRHKKSAGRGSRRISGGNWNPPLTPSAAVDGSTNTKSTSVGTATEPALSACMQWPPSCVPLVVPVEARSGAPVPAPPPEPSYPQRHVQPYSGMLPANPASVPTPTAKKKDINVSNVSAKHWSAATTIAQHAGCYTTSNGPFGAYRCQAQSLHGSANTKGTYETISSSTPKFMNLNLSSGIPPSRTPNGTQFQSQETDSVTELLTAIGVTNVRIQPPVPASQAFFTTKIKDRQHNTSINSFTQGENIVPIIWQKRNITNNDGGTKLLKALLNVGDSDINSGAVPSPPLDPPSTPLIQKQGDKFLLLENKENVERNRRNLNFSRRNRNSNKNSSVYDHQQRSTAKKSSTQSLPYNIIASANNPQILSRSPDFLKDNMISSLVPSLTGTVPFTSGAPTNHAESLTASMPRQAVNTSSQHQRHRHNDLPILPATKSSVENVGRLPTSHNVLQHASAGVVAQGSILLESSNSPLATTSTIMQTTNGTGAANCYQSSPASIIATGMPVTPERCIN